MCHRPEASVNVRPLKGGATLYVWRRKGPTAGGSPHFEREPNQWLLDIAHCATDRAVRGQLPEAAPALKQIPINGWFKAAHCATDRAVSGQLPEAAPAHGMAWRRKNSQLASVASMPEPLLKIGLPGQEWPMSPTMHCVTLLSSWPQLVHSVAPRENRHVGCPVAPFTSFQWSMVLWRAPKLGGGPPRIGTTKSTPPWKCSTGTGRWGRHS
mmetsp:Transcript_59575/g.177254  ORF Transcript_59575/g.177254 Transcript_59575/m.177254 type:complete len:211 (+) Transcript_59575:84-716(+)